jgi:ubiquitin-protein ligase
MNKRLYKEISRLTSEQNKKQLLDNDYLVYLDEFNINKVYTIIKAPHDSVYRHRFIRLNFDIPNEYPYKPPVVTFVNYNNVRIHPNFYEDGKCCSTILNSWPSLESDGIKIEAWSSSMGIETVLLTFRSFLDNNPYTHEPGGRDDPSYTTYVSYQTWETCLFKYLNRYQPELFSQYIQSYIYNNIEEIFNDIYLLKQTYPAGSYFTPCFYIYEYNLNYDIVINDLLQVITEFNTQINLESSTSSIGNNTQIDSKNDNDYKDSKNDNDYKASKDDNDYKDSKQESNTCNICFDPLQLNTTNTLTLECGHLFHITCIKRHILHNGKLCSLCRSKTITDEKIINPETNKKIKIDGITYNKLIKGNVLQTNL